MPHRTSSGAQVYFEALQFAKRNSQARGRKSPPRGCSGPRDRSGGKQGPRPLEARAAGLTGQLWHTDSGRTASSHPLRKLQIVHAIHHRLQPTAPTRFPTAPPTPNPVPPIRVSVSRSLLQKWRRESCPIDRSECALTAHARRARSRAPSNLLLTRQPVLLAILLTGTFRALIHRLGADHLRDNPEPKGLLCDRQTPDPGEHGERQNGHRSDRQLAHHFRALTAQCACAPATHGPDRASHRRVHGEPITGQCRFASSQSAFGGEGLTPILKGEPLNCNG